MSGLVASRFPSVSSLLLSLFASVTLLALIRVAFTRFVTFSIVTSTDADEKGVAVHRTPSNGTSLEKSWNWSWQWERMNLSLPVSLSMGEKDCPGIGGGTGVAVALQEQERHQRQQPTHTPKARWQTHRRNVGFEPPLPALYDTPVPMSMAKMIMSRHTYRKPSLNRPPPRVASQTRTASQPPSRPLHAIV